jgi:hypothetical protein
LVAGCCLALLIAEGAVRLLVPHARDYVLPAGLLRMDADLGWRLTPNARGRHRSRYFDVVYAVNDDGFRDPPWVETKANVFRILVYGDSQVFGWGIEAGKRFTDLVTLEEPRLELRNLGVPGYGLDQEVLLYEYATPSTAVNEVFFFVSNATLQRTLLARAYQKPKPRFVVGANGSLSVTRISAGADLSTDVLYRALSPFYLPYFLERMLASRQPAASPQTKGASPESFGPLQRAIIDHAIALGRERGHRITLLVFLPQDVAAEVVRFADQRGAGSMTIAFPIDVRFGEHDGHFNPVAHAMIAAQLRGELQARHED